MSQWNATSTKVSAIFVAGVAGVVLVAYATSDSSKPPPPRPHHVRSHRSCPPLEPLPSDGSEEGHFYELDHLAKQELASHHLDAAAALAAELLELAPKYEQNWNYGNAVHGGHTVLGQVALARGDVAEARRQLLASGATPGSPQ
ncbi:MAG TPA: hypothetical protein VFV99_29580, partial [Kofleriaceae bacterium]|nr:hypothetical protein [Kofleriaceae bacterium]